jgi:carboxymethylenebutenolidase
MATWRFEGSEDMAVASERVRIETPGGVMPAYLARPAGSETLPAILVIQEAFGLNEHIEDVARRIAAAGYVALAPDMYHRGGERRTASYADLGTAIGLMNELKDDEIVADLDAAIAWLRARIDVRGDRLGITGFCMGGRISYLMACARPETITAAAPFYGGGIPVDRTPALRCPVLALFGGDDAFIPPEQVSRLEAAAREHDKAVDIVVYPGAPHGFFCNERDSYRADAAADAWRRLMDFLRTHLGA